MTNEQEKKWPLCRAEKVIGSNFEEWCKNLSPELYSKGDCVIAWVVEADLYALPQSSQAIIDAKDRELEAEREKVMILRDASRQALYLLRNDKNGMEEAKDILNEAIAATSPEEPKEN